MATDKAYSRKLEAKLSASRSISDLHARCSQYKLKLRELAQEIQEAESRTESVQELADARADEVSQILHLRSNSGLLLGTVASVMPTSNVGFFVFFS